MFFLLLTFIVPVAGTGLGMFDGKSCVLFIDISLFDTVDG